MDASCKYILFDVDNTLYPRSSGLGRAMGDRIVHWCREKIDLKNVDTSSICSVEELCDAKAYNHPPDIDATDELVERVCLTYYRRYGLTIVGMMKELGVGDELMHDYLDYVHHPSKTLEHYMPHPHEHVATKNLLNSLKENESVGLYLFSNAHDDHVNRIMQHLDVPLTHFDGILEFLQLLHDCKPNVGAYEMMLRMIRKKYSDAKFEECLFLDDSKANLKTAKDCGMKTVLVGWEKTDEDYIDFCIDDVRNEKEMWEILQKSCGIKKK